jgi:hypothetical protein
MVDAPLTTARAFHNVFYRTRFEGFPKLSQALAGALAASTIDRAIRPLVCARFVLRQYLAGPWIVATPCGDATRRRSRQV